eukprot:scaffold34620_cov160-Amphora_coffeaeformis.AAC.1
MWDCFKAAEEVGDAVCKSFFQDPTDDVDSRNVFKTDAFYDAQSIVESSVSTWSDISSENRCLPMSISFPTTDPSSWRDASERKVKDNNSQAPSDERQNEEDSSWNDTASFMTPDQQDMECRGLWGEDDYPETKLGGASPPELPFDEGCSLPYTPSRQSSENRVELKVQKRRAREIAIETLTALTHPDDEEEEDEISTEKEVRRETPSRREPEEPAVNEKAPSHSHPRLVAINDHLMDTLSRIKTSTKVPLSPIRRGMAQVLSFGVERPLGGYKEGSSPGIRMTIREPIVRESPPRAIIRPVCQASPSYSESTVFGGLEEESSIDSSGVGVHWGAAAWHMSRNIDAAFGYTQTKAAITIQTAIRGHLARNCARLLLENLIHDTAVLIIQDCWLTHRAKKRRGIKTPKDDVWFCFEEEDLPPLNDTVLLSNEGCEVLLGIQIPPSELVRTSSMGRSSTSLVSTLSFEMHRSSSPCGQEDDLFLTTVPADGSSSPIPWRTSPPRKEFFMKRLEMMRLPTIAEDEEEGLPDDKFDAPSKDVWMATKTSPTKRAETNDTDQELDQFELNRSDDSRGLIPPPRLRRLAEFSVHDLFTRASTPSSPMSLSLDDGVVDNQSHSSSQGTWRRIFGIVELARWLQAVTRGFICRQRYTKLRRAVVTIQTWCRFQTSKRLLIEKQIRDPRNTCYSPVKSPPLSLSRPPLYPDSGSPVLPQKIATARQSRRAIQRLAKIAIEGPSVDEAEPVSEVSVTISWPVPNTHYHHRTQLLEIQKTYTLPAFERESCLNLPPIFLEELEVHNVRSGLETFSTTLQDCHNSQDFQPWTNCHSTSDTAQSLAVPDLNQLPKYVSRFDQRKRLNAAICIQRIYRGA